MKELLMIGILSLSSSAFAMDLSQITCEAGLVNRDGSSSVIKREKMNYNLATGYGGFDTFRPGADGRLADDYRVEVHITSRGRANIMFYDKVSGTETLTSTDIVDGKYIFAYLQNSKGLLGKKDITRIYLSCEK